MKQKSNKTPSAKYIDQQLISALTDVCEDLKQQVQGFEWLTHQGDLFAKAPLRITCVFGYEHEINSAIENNATAEMQSQITQAVKTLRNSFIANNKTLRNAQTKQTMKNHINGIFDSEEACDASHQGDWQVRLNTKIH